MKSRAEETLAEPSLAYLWAVLVFAGDICIRGRWVCAPRCYPWKHTSSREKTHDLFALSFAFLITRMKAFLVEGTCQKFREYLPPAPREVETLKWKFRFFNLLSKTFLTSFHLFFFFICYHMSVTPSFRPVIFI